jgi:hypothetical protein
MLEAIREFGLEQLTAVGETEALEEARAAYIVAFAEHVMPATFGPEQGHAADLLDDEQANIRATFGYLLAAASPEHRIAGLRLAAALGHYWLIRANPREARGWLDQLLASEDVPPVLLLWPALWAAMLAWYQQDQDAADRHTRRGIELARPAMGQPSAIEGALWLMPATAARESGRFDDALTVSDHALAILDGAADAPDAAVLPVARAHLLHERSMALYAAGDREQAAVAGDAAMALLRGLGTWFGASLALSHYAEVALADGDVAAGAALYLEKLECSRRSGRDPVTGDPDGTADALDGLARVAATHSRTALAQQLARAARDLRQRTGRRFAYVSPAVTQEAMRLTHSLADALPLDVDAERNSPETALQAAIAFATELTESHVSAQPAGTAPGPYRHGA